MNFSSVLRRCLLFGVFLAIIGQTIFFAVPVHAADEIVVTDKRTMQFKGATYIDQDTYDDENEWVGGPASCRHTMKIDDFNGSPKGKVQLKAANSFGDCVNDGSEITNISLGGAEKRFITAYRTGTDTLFVPISIEFSGGCSSQPGLGVKRGYDLAETSDYFKRPLAADRIKQNYYHLVDGDNFDDSHALITATTDKAEFANICGEATPMKYDTTLVLANGGERTTVPEIYGLSPTGQPPGTEGAQPQKTCESEGASLSWIICPILTVMDGAIEYLDTQINNVLAVPNDYFENDPTNPDEAADQLQATWARMRNLAYIILVPIMLIMVISTALGFEFISSYTVKKALPRLVAAVLFIALSWQICTFLIVLTNDIGSGVGGLISSSFGGYSEITLSSIMSPNTSDSVVATGGIFIGAIIASVTILSLGVILSYAFVAFLGLFMAFVLLSFRQLLVIALILVAPLAIIAWIFPGNDKMWKLWWGTFSKLLILYPLIVALIATGKSFASVVSDVESGTVGTLIKLIAYIGPYFFIPAAFKFAGGIFANISGMVNDRSKGIFDRNKKYRAGQIGQTWERKGERRIMQARSNWAGKLQDSASSVDRNRFNKGLRRFGAARLTGYNLPAAESAKQAAVSKEINDQIATGRDDSIRGLTASHSYDYAKQHGWEQAVKDGYAREKDGKRQYQTLAGAYVNEADVIEGRQRWGKDKYAQQAALSYEMRKAMNSGQVAGVSKNFSAFARSVGMNERDAGGAWIGAAFENQNQHLEYKHTNAATGALDYAAFAEEAAEKKGSYPISQMSGHTIEQLEAAYDAPITSYKATPTKTAAEVMADTKKNIVAIAETFEQRGGMAGMTGEPGSEVPVYASGGGREPVVSAPGAAKVNEAAKRLYDKTHGPEYGPPDPATRPMYGPPDPRGPRRR